MKPRRGFTILELSVVLALMAVLAAAVSLSFTRRLGAANQEQALQAIQALDQRARAMARTHEASYHLQLDGRRGSMALVEDLGGSKTTVDAVQIDRGHGIQDVWVLIRGRRITRDVLTIPIDPQGCTPTYGFTLMPVDTGPDPAAPIHLLVAGISGQCTPMDNHEQVNDILSSVVRHDAD